MALNNIVEEVLNDLNDMPKHVEALEKIKKKLKKEGFKESYNEIVRNLDIREVIEFLKVWEKLDALFNKKRYPWGGSNDRRDDSFKVMKELSKMDNAEEMLEALAESGYRLKIYNHPDKILNATYIHLVEYEDLRTFQKFIKEDFYKKYYTAFKALKKIGYQNIDNYSESSRSVQFDNLIAISRLEGDVVGAIYILASRDYKVDKEMGITTAELQGIEKIVKGIHEEKSKEIEGIHIYLYEAGNVKVFQDYFTNLSSKDKEKVLKSLLEYENKDTETNNSQEITNWLEENYKELLKEVAFKTQK